MENTSATNPNKKKFIESLASKSYKGPSIVDYLNKSGYDSSLASRNQLATDYGIKNYVPGSAQSNTALMAALRGGSPVTGNVTNPSGTNVPGASDTTTTPTGSGTTTPSDPYKEYLKSLFDPEAIKTAQTNLADINKRTADELARARYTEGKIRENESGMLERGLNYNLSEEARKSNQSLADLAIARGASADVVEQLLSAGKDLSNLTLEEQKLLQKETPSPFELSPGQTRYAYDEATGTYKPVASLPATPKATGAGTVTERQASILGSYAKGFQPGETLPDGTPALDQNNFITPKAWKTAIADAVSKGIKRANFIQQYGNMLYGENLDAYQLTPAEKSIIQNTSKISSDELDPALQALLDSLQ